MLRFLCFKSDAEAEWGRLLGHEIAASAGGGCAGPPRRQPVPASTLAPAAATPSSLAIAPAPAPSDAQLSVIFY